MGWNTLFKWLTLMTVSSINCHPLAFCSFHFLLTAGESLTPAGEAGSDTLSCPNDYVIINGLRLCGDRFNDGSVIMDNTMNAPVTGISFFPIKILFVKVFFSVDTSGGPIVIQVRTDSSVTGRGFKLFYMQNRCPGMRRQ